MSRKVPATRLGERSERTPPTEGSEGKMDIVEKVARAAHDRREGVLPEGVPRIGGRPFRWEELPEFARQHELAVARAAIEALLEPTEEMIDAADGGGDSDWANRYVYRAMLHKALGKPYNWRVDG